MCALHQSTKQWIKEDLIPKLKKIFHKTGSEVKYEISIPENTQFLSMLFFLDLQFLGDWENSKNMVS